MGKYLINELVQVEEAGATRSHGKGERREDYADAWRDTGNVVLVGLPGSGKAALAEALAERTGAPVATPGDAAAAAAALAGRGTIVVLADGLVEDPAVRPLIHGAGKVFYLMADSSILSARAAEREGAADREDLWREFSARLAVMEPVFYEVLHFIVQAGGTPDAMVGDALEKIAY
ncbi:hypothetical protein [Pseudodesulfovibrio sp.]|uniref:hypothetical protein n=1 Tax=Pseudodesulfovibrio sp. TaxID=2035812 RepID=UPI00261912A4|nr:hypothetical protein [Pseudodesulfovibrio sp.]MDD3313257.1 hypothetical protein [Pseudodesulfovibrio sp.]